MIVRRWIVAAALLLAGGMRLAAPAAAEDKPIGLQPPASVASAEKGECDRDKAHLADFVVKFLEWYVDNEINVEAQPLRGDAAIKFLRESLRPFDRLLSSGFNAKLARQQKDIDTAPNGDLPKPDPSLKSLCGGADADNILCAQDFDPSWRTVITANVTAMKPNSATVAASMPWAPDAKAPPHRLTVTLIPERGSWRIDRIATPDK